MSELVPIEKDGQAIGYVIGEVAGEKIQLVLSAKSSVEGIQRARHLIATPVRQKEMTMASAEAAGVTAGQIIDLVKATKAQWLPLLLATESPADIGLRFESNDVISATMDAPHCHVIVAHRDLWKGGAFRRCVDSIRATVPVEVEEFLSSTWLRGPVTKTRRLLAYKKL